MVEPALITVDLPVVSVAVGSAFKTTDTLAAFSPLHAYIPAFEIMSLAPNRTVVALFTCASASAFDFPSAMSASLRKSIFVLMNWSFVTGSI